MMSDEKQAQAKTRSVFKVTLWESDEEGRGHSDKFRVLAESAQHAAKARVPGSIQSEMRVISVELADNEVYELPEDGWLDRR